MTTLERLPGRWRLMAALLIMPLLFTFDLTAAQADTRTDLRPGGDEPVDREILLAGLEFRTGVEVRFTRDELSGDFGLVQDGRVDRNGPVIGDADSLLVAYLQVTPRSVPVPRELLAEWPAGTPYPAELAGRSVVPAPVRAEALVAPAGTAAASTVTCWSAYHDPYHWYEPAGHPNPSSKFHSEKNFYSSQHGGMARYSRAFLANCGTWGVKYRVFYKSAGTYYVQHSHVVPVSHWQSVQKGSVHRYRKVHYEQGFGYTRNGRFV